MDIAYNYNGQYLYKFQWIGQQSAEKAAEIKNLKKEETSKVTNK